MTDAPRTAAEMREAAAQCYENGFPTWDVFGSAAAAIRAIPVAEADDEATVAIPSWRSDLAFAVAVLDSAAEMPRANSRARSVALIVRAAANDLAAQAADIARLTRERDEARDSDRESVAMYRRAADRAAAAEAEAARLTRERDEAEARAAAALISAEQLQATLERAVRAEAEAARLTQERDEARRSLRHALVERDQTFKLMHDRATAAEAEAARLREASKTAHAAGAQAMLEALTYEHRGGRYVAWREFADVLSAPEVQAALAPQEPAP